MQSSLASMSFLRVSRSQTALLEGGAPNDLTWLACQTCWKCGKTGHLHQKCAAMQEERDAYREKNAMEWEKGTANAAMDETEDKVMVTECQDM